MCLSPSSSDKYTKSHCASPSSHLRLSRGTLQHCVCLCGILPTPNRSGSPREVARCEEHLEFHTYMLFDQSANFVFTTFLAIMAVSEFSGCSLQVCYADVVVSHLPEKQVRLFESCLAFFRLVFPVTLSRLTRLVRRVHRLVCAQISSHSFLLAC